MFDTRNFHEIDPGYAVIFIPESNGAASKRPWDGATRDNNCARKRLFNRHKLLILDKRNEERK
jgi:hypothetical protein